MFDRPFGVEIITPDRTVLKLQAFSVSAPGVKGGFQILYNHAPILSVLGPGKVKVMGTDGKEHVYATGGGFLEMRDNHTVLLLDSAETPEDIDVARARAAKERAENRIKTRQAGIDTARAEAALRRALNRLRIAGVS